MGDLSNERLLQVFAGALMVMLAWVLSTMIAQVKVDRANMEALLERIVKLEQQVSHHVDNHEE